MCVRRLLLFTSLLLMSGCRWPVRPEADQMACRIANQPYDVIYPDRDPKLTKPRGGEVSDKNAGDGDTGDKEASDRDTRDRDAGVPELPSARPDLKPPVRLALKSPEPPDVSLDAQAAGWMHGQINPLRRDDPPGNDVNRLPDPTQVESGPFQNEPRGPRKSNLDLQIPMRIPGSSAPRVELPRDARRNTAIDQIYTELPPLPLEPQVGPGPDGNAYTLSDLQRIAAANSAALRQAISDVQAARGALLQAKTYQNPTAGYLVDPTNINTTAGVQGFFFSQSVRTAGKQKFGVGAAQVRLENAQLALRRARSDLSTAVRAGYFAVLVDQETLAVLRDLVRFTDEMYRLQTGLLKGAQAASFEPTALRAQAVTVRLAYKQALATYFYDWTQLVATLNLHQLPLSKVDGAVDRLFPYYEYDRVKVRVLQNHTDILTARNQVPIARYNLQLAQVQPIPDFDVRMAMGKDYTVAPFGTYKTLALSMPVPIFNQNKGNIINAQAALIRASEESHRAEASLVYNLGQAYTNYQNNLIALEDYRCNILPDLVRYYRGVYARRQVDPSSSFGDLAFAQQNLSSNVIAYLGVLGSAWSSVVALADFLQTDDLFQMATPRELPELPDLSQLNPWPCGHTALADACDRRSLGGQPGAMVAKVGETKPVLAQSNQTKNSSAAGGNSVRGADSVDRRPPLVNVRSEADAAPRTRQ
jgi:cobalt-zinc-cadmium efflux system outer membrane protein